MAENNTYNETVRSAFSRVEEVLEEDSIAVQLRKERYAHGRQKNAPEAVRITTTAVIYHGGRSRAFLEEFGKYGYSV